MKQCHNCKIYVSRIINLKGNSYCPKCFKKNGLPKKSKEHIFRWNGLRELYRTKEQLLNHIAVFVVAIGVGTGIYLMTHHLLLLGILMMWMSLFTALIPHFLSEIDGEWFHKKNTQTILKIKSIDYKTKKLISKLYKNYEDRFKTLNCQLQMTIRRNKSLDRLKSRRDLRDYESVVEIKVKSGGNLIDYDEGKLILIVELVNTNYISVWINKMTEIKQELKDDLELAHAHVNELYYDGVL
ncbi:hypothetical protein [Haloplasma contractile]|uniref:Uncharacterized protein n=1 Tax=Haloplasma contractile SSD-17B TaxID=1033810 RepID=U2E9M6_9MOLU|nr:hypothetical protein [Haloplasma contractile]ERJ11843.1 hypothetical protein HLPCO_002082 [Haloplasma contractile SSD-17B]